MTKFEQKIGRYYTDEERRYRAIERHIYGMGTTINDDDYMQGWMAEQAGDVDVHQFVAAENYSAALGWVHRYFEEVEEEEVEEND